MPEPDLTAVIDLIQDTPSFSATGELQPKTLVRFHVGQHGPFQFIFEPGKGTPEAIRAAIEKKVQDLRALLMPGA